MTFVPVLRTIVRNPVRTMGRGPRARWACGQPTGVLNGLLPTWATDPKLMDHYGLRTEDNRLNYSNSSTIKVQYPVKLTPLFLHPSRAPHRIS
jgi:hypothetical protein